MEPGPIIKSLFGSPDDLRCLHFGIDGMEFACSVVVKIPGCYYLVCTKEEFDSPVTGVNTLVSSPLELDDTEKYDFVVVPGKYEQFATAIYVAIESILKEGGMVAITHPELRPELMKAMTKEGTIAPYAKQAYINNDFWLFRLENNRLNREF